MGKKPTSSDEVFDRRTKKLSRAADSPQKRTLIKGLQSLKGACNGLLRSASMKYSPPESSVPKGYRLPTETEYNLLNGISNEIGRLRSLINTTTGNVKKGFIQQRRKLNQALIEFTESRKIHYVPKNSTFTKDSEPS